MLTASEAQRRVDRRRRIVAQQRELVAKIGDAFPIAGELLKLYEKSLALLESTLENHLRHEPDIGPPDPVLDGADDAAWDHEEQVRKVARLMEVLRQGGYHCELAQGTQH
jgi:hypothetical protein